MKRFKIIIIRIDYIIKYIFKGVEFWLEEKKVNFLYILIYLE